MDRVDQEYMEEIMKSTDSSDSPRGSKEIVSVKDDGTTEEDIEVCTKRLSYYLRKYLGYAFNGNQTHTPKLIIK